MVALSSMMWRTGMMETTAIDNSRSNFIQTLALAQVAEIMFTSRLIEIEPRWRLVLDDARAERSRLLLRAVRNAVAKLEHLGDFALALAEIGSRSAGQAIDLDDYRVIGAV